MLRLIRWCMQQMIVAIVAIIAITAMVFIGIGAVLPPQTQTLPEDTAGKVFTAVGGESCAPATCYCRDGIPPPVTVSCPKGLKKKVTVKRDDRYFNMPSMSGT